MLGKLIQDYLNELKVAGKSAHTIRNYSAHLQKFQLFIESNRLDYHLLNGRETKAFRQYLVDLRLKPRSVNAVLAAVKSFFDYLVDQGKIKGNPFLLKRLKVTETKELPGFLTEAEEEKVREGFATLPYHVSLAFRTMLATGIRVSETANLAPKDVIVSDSRVFILVWGKGSKQRLVPILDIDVAKEVLQLAEARMNEPTLFGVSDSTLKWYAFKIRKKTGIHFHSHRCRHTLATRLLRQGVPLDVVQEILGHESILTTRKYSKTAPESLLRLAPTLDTLPPSCSRR